MGEDDVSRQLFESSRILEEHSYHKMRKNSLSYAKKIELLISKEPGWSSSSDVNDEKSVNCQEKSKTVPPSPMPTNKDKIVKKKARVEDIIKNLKKGKTLIKKAKEDNESTSFASMCTIREEPDNIDVDLPPIKPPPVQHEPKQDNKTVFFVPAREPTTARSTVYLSTSTASCTTAPQVIYQAIPQTKEKQQMPLILNRIPTGNIVNIDHQNTQSTANNPLTAPTKLLLISRPGAPPIYLNVQDKPTVPNNINVRPAGQVVTNSGNEVVKTTQPPLIIQYRLPYPNNTCKIVNSPANAFSSPPGQTLPNLACNETLGSFAKPLVAGTQKPLEIPVNFAGNQMAYVTTVSEDRDLLTNRETAFPPLPFPGRTSRISSTKQNKKATSKSGKSLKRTFMGRTQQNKVKTGLGKQGNIQDKHISKTNSSDQTKSHQTGHALPLVRVSNRKRHRTEKALNMDKNKKRKLNNRNNILQLRYAKKGNKKSQTDVKSASVDQEFVVDKDTKGDVQDSQSLSDNSKEIRESSQNNVTSDDVVESSKETNENGNLFRDPALLTREERALQRALMLFKEMENKQARKSEQTDRSSKPASLNKPKRNLRKRIQFKQLNTNVELSRKRKLINNSANSFVKRRKLNIEQQAAQRKAAQLTNKLVQQGNEIDVGDDKKVKRRPVSLNDTGKRMPTNMKHRVKKLAVNTIEDKDIPQQSIVKSVKCLKEATHSKTQLKSPQTQLKSSPALVEMKSLSLQQKSPTTPSTQVKSLSKHLKSSPAHFKSPSLKPEKGKDTNDKHRVKTYMLIPSYHGFQDFSPVLLGSRTRNKKAEQSKSDADDAASAGTKNVETPKKDVPLLVIETVNNKPVKQDVVVKDEHLRNIVTTSLRAQGMLKKDLEKKVEDEQHFENREKRNITVNRNTGETVLHKAARMGYDETVYHSIQQGCNSNAKDYAGWTPLHEACSRGHSDVVKVLVKYNADVNSCSNDGIRPIHDAADNGNTDSLRLLIAYDADPLLSTYSGRTCLDCAKTKKTKDYIQGCIGDLYLTDERNSIVSLDYEDRWEFRGSCSVLDKDGKYMRGIFDDIPAAKKGSTSVEFEWSDTPHLPTYNLPLKKDGVITGRKNYVRFQDLQERLGKSRSTLIRLLKRTEIREVPWSEFSKEVSNSCFNKLFEAPAGCSTEKVEMVPLNWNVRCLLKVKSENISL